MSRSDRISELYHRQIWNGLTQDIARDRIHWICSQADGKRVLDVGCSQGISSILLAREGFEVVGIDIDPGVIEFAQAEAEREPPAIRARLAFLEKDLQDLEEQPFDTVIAGEILEHQANARRFIEHCARFVAPGGKLVLTTPFGLHPHPDHKAILYPQQVVDAVSASLALDSIEVAHGYIRCTATRRTADESAGPPLEELLLRLTEQGARDAQTRLYGLLDQKSQLLKNHATQAERLEQEKADALAGAMAVQKQVELKETRLAELEQTHAALGAELAGLRSDQVAALAAAERDAHVRETLEAELAAARHGLAEADEALEDRGALLAEAHRVASTWAQRAELIEAEAQSSSLALEGLKAELETRSRRDGLHAAGARRIARLDVDVRHLRAALRDREQELHVARQALEAAVQERATTDAALRQAQDRASDADRRAEALQGDVHEAGRERTELHQVLDALGGELEQLATDSQALRTTLGALEADRIRSFEVTRTLEDGHEKLGRDLAIERCARTGLEQQNREARSEVERLRRLKGELALKLERSTETISYQLGHTLLHSGRSLRGMARLPRQLLVLRREAKARRSRRSRDGTRTSAGDGRAGERGRGMPPGATIAELMAKEPAAACTEIMAMACPAALRARLLTELAKANRSSDLTASVTAGRAAHVLDPQPWRAKWLASLLYDAGVIGESAGLIAQAGEKLELGGRDATRAEIIRGLARVQTGGIEVPARAAIGFSPIARRILYVVHRSLPHDAVGYTIRTQGLLKALVAGSYEMRPVTRMGYPWDEPAGRDLNRRTSAEQVDGITYARLAGSRVSSTPLDHYIEEAAQLLVRHAREIRPALIHAASNHVNALPALIAARRLGLPFVYEVRGLWELTAASRNPAFEDSERFKLMRDLEVLVTREADRVVTISEALRQELVARGVPARQVGLAPNAVDVERFRPREPDRALANGLGLGNRFVIGFVGSLTGYEGLADLLAVLPDLVARGVDPVLLLVGDGEAAAGIRSLAQQLDLSGRVIFTGRVPPEDVPSYYSLIDVAAFPRSAYRVCELVPPLKPLEAMAMATPVVASNLPAIAESVRHQETGLLFRSGDRHALAAALLRLAGSADERAKLGEAGRAFVNQERSWPAVAVSVIDAYRELLP